MTRSDEREATTTDPVGVDSRLRRPGGISYLHIPAVDVQEAAYFYEKVFGWNVHGHDTTRPSFDDGTGHVSGAWMTTQAISREPGLLPYIYVERIYDAVERIVSHGGRVVRAPYPEGNLWVATFLDPAGNMIGLWQECPR